MNGRITPALAFSLAALVPHATSKALAAPAEIEGALLMVEAPSAAPGSDRSGAPPRFVLMKDGTVYLGGTSQVETGRLDKGELSALRKRIDAARKATRRGGATPAADAATAVRLRFPDDAPGEIAVDPLATGPLSVLLAELLDFDHPSLVRYPPVRYRLAAREEQLPGGCRRWTLGFPLETALSTPVVVPASDVVGWPTGAMPASVCSGGRRYVVTLRPLLPGEPLE